MCGFTGFWARSSAGGDIAAIATTMADHIRHRGPDDGGAWADTETGIAIAHRRLSILDLSPAGHQPMASASGRWVLAYNGEVYNHLELRKRLEAEGAAPAWRGHSDTETLLAAIEAWGVDDTIKRSVGMFALALWDRQDRTLWLARDRIGEKPLYYGWQGDTFLFGSELKALRAHPVFNAAIDRGAVAMLLRHNYIPAPYSIYQGIHKLPPGTWLRLGSGERDVEPVAYWSLAAVAERGMAHPFEGSEADALDALERHLGNAVRGQMVADVPLGALLSGGIDSTVIAALMQASSSRPVRTFTIGFDEKQYDEATHARAVAAHLGTDHTELRLSGDDALALVPRMPAMYDEPFADSSQLPTHLVMKLARQHVTVALSGDAGDEMFGGYNRYFLGPKTWDRIRWMPPVLRRAFGAALTALPATTVNRMFGPVAGRAGIALPGDKAHKLGARLTGVRSLDDLYVSLVSEWPDPAGTAVGGHMPPNLLDDRLRWPKLGDPVARMMALDGLTYLPDDILVKVDRASMAVSLETRAPFLDRDVMEFAWSLPMHMKLRNGKGKWLLRQLVDRHVPRALMERPKMGFGIPLDQWLRGPLREWGETLLAEDRLKREGYFDPAPIRATWLRHQRGEGSFGYRLWAVLMFQAWLEQEGGNA
ncbi:asparagine synthase (glutamine-hydrolyzing) [Luteimonas sp. MC1572]|uniref:asparagine synthase (glutamine-hydrolyzing) n=1 Tax=Luteimonas sp. MC1572 TaxID=2799325 RepID=UPI0018F0D7FC|nr:asparagine synthase (glutamine-hydrolyzing) [Luteimonas sp. MC1572]MBJ6983006.1 asparagine synthase (glutamine-hydrolyzing) [Luteimonas sp. MC1572]QQO04220.1 asparagine synthase (glutamine-hydrolyzing) [Luteimonas sp. MC1572]